jgi:PAS domain S-box-containing protein
MDTSGRIVDVNEQAVRIFGGSKEDLLGKHFTRVGVVSSTNLPRITKAFASILLGRGAPLEVQIRNKKGQMRFLECSYSVMKTGGKLAGILAIARNITERKKAEKALLEPQQKFERLFNGSPEAAVFVDTKDHVQDINSRFSELFGYSSEEALGKALDDLIVPTDKREEAEILTQKSMVGYVDHETVRKRKDGLSIPVLISAAPVTLEGQSTGCVVLYRDIAERKRIEERIVESEERLRQLLECAPDAIYMNDLNGSFLDGNRQAEELTGYAKQELIGKNMLQLGILPEKYVSKAIEALEKSVRGERSGPDEFELVRKDGSAVWVEMSTFPVKRGREVEVLGIARDITERKRMEEQLRESEERLRGITERSFDAIIAMDLEGRITFVSFVAERILGYRPEEIIGKSLHTFFTEREIPKAAQAFAEVVSGKSMRGLELELLRKDGSSVTVEVNSAPIIKDGKVVGVQATARDISERKQMQQKLQEYSEELEAIEYSNKIITDLLEYSRDVHLELTETTPKLIIRETLSLLEVPNNIQIINLAESEPRIKADIEKLKSFHQPDQKRNRRDTLWWKTRHKKHKNER